MKSISVIIDQHSKYSIDLQDEYQLNEFINFFEWQLQMVKKISQGSSIMNVQEIGENTIFKRNNLFDQMNKQVKGLGNDIELKNNKTMRTYTSIKKSTSKRKGLVWLKPMGNTLVIILRQGDYSRVDVKDKIAYSKPDKKTLGNLPTMTIRNDPAEIEYAFKMIKHIYDKS